MQNLLKITQIYFKPTQRLFKASLWHFQQKEPYPKGSFCCFYISNPIQNIPFVSSTQRAHPKKSFRWFYTKSPTNTFQTQRSSLATVQDPIQAVYCSFHKYAYPAGADSSPNLRTYYYYFLVLIFSTINHVII